jgi:hypothetical protein
MFIYVKSISNLPFIIFVFKYIRHYPPPLLAFHFINVIPALEKRREREKEKEREVDYCVKFPDITAKGHRS